MKSHNFQNNVYEGQKGRVLLELSKTYDGDDRFKLNQKFKDDIQIDKLPQKFKQIAQKDIIDAATIKNKKIKKRKLPLLITRYEPGTQKSEKIAKKAQNRRKHIEALKKGEKKKKMQLKKGVNNVKRAEMLLKDTADFKRPYFNMTVNGNKKQAFQSSQFRLFQ